MPGSSLLQSQGPNQIEENQISMSGYRQDLVGYGSSLIDGGAGGQDERVQQPSV